MLGNKELRPEFCLAIRSYDFFLHLLIDRVPFNIVCFNTVVYDCTYKRTGNNYLVFVGRAIFFREKLDEFCPKKGRETKLLEDGRHQFIARPFIRHHCIL